jgi:hypothetical protein
MFNQSTLALLLAGMLTTASASAAEENERPRTYSSERPIETDTTGLLPLPRALPGSITLRPCEVCALLTLDLTASARFFIDRKPVTFADLRALAQSSSANAVVLYDSKTHAVTRILVSDAR